MNDSSEIIKRIEAIENRNASVTLDKEWETSWTRKVAIIICTYVVVWVYLYFIGNENPTINAAVPPAGFLLSTVALEWLRKYWQGRK